MCVSAWVCLCVHVHECVCMCVLVFVHMCTRVSQGGCFENSRKPVRGEVSDELSTGVKLDSVEPATVSPAWLAVSGPCSPDMLAVSTTVIIGNLLHVCHFF